MAAVDTVLLLVGVALEFKRILETNLVRQSYCFISHCFHFT